MLNEFLLPHIHNGDTVVDFSCGANVWVPMLKNMCLEAGIVSMLPSFAAVGSLSQTTFVLCCSSSACFH